MRSFTVCACCQKLCAKLNWIELNKKKGWVWVYEWSKSLDNSLLLIMCYMCYTFLYLVSIIQWNTQLYKVLWMLVIVVGGGDGTLRRRDSAKCCWMFINLLKLSVYLGIQCFDISLWCAHFRGRSERTFLLKEEAHFCCFPFLLVLLLLSGRWGVFHF